MTHGRANGFSGWAIRPCRSESENQVVVKESNPSDGSDLFDERAFLNLRTPLRRYGTPEEIAKVVLFLASD